MGIYFSCPLAAYNDLESGFESIIVKSINFGDDKAKTPVRSISFKVQDSKPTTMQSIGSRKMIIEECVSFRTRETEVMSSIKAPSSNETNAFTKPISSQSKEVANGSPRSDSVTDKIPRLPIFDSSNPKHEAAIKLQKVYKSFRTRRKLADCAVLIEQSWWKLLDYAELKRSSISFFELEKNETAISRWSRARTRAAKVGKGLSKNGKAQKLALQHWLEAIDPRHRYGHNLHFYYVKWLHSQSKEPFFYWLDIGEGKEVNLVEKCSRSKLLLQCIKYLGPMERKAYKVVVEDGKLLFKQTRVLLDTTVEPKGDKWIFVLSTSGILYVGKKRKGSFQHSSFLAGGATLAAGRIVVEKGILKAVWPHSGHYRPTPENFQDFVSFLRENNVDITDVKMDSVDEEEESLVKQSSSHMRSNSSDEDLISKDRLETEEIDVKEFDMKTNSTEEETTAANFEQPQPMVSHCHSFSKKLTNLQIPKRVDLLERVKNEKPAVESPLDGYETAEESFASEKNYDEEPVPEESILRRINSHKGMKSYQLGKQLSCKWSTGAGPRIGCVRDYPSGLQSHALERVNLSPRSAHCVRSNSSPRVLTPTGFNREMQVVISPLPHRSSILHFRTQSSPLCKVASVAAIGKLS